MIQDIFMIDESRYLHLVSDVLRHIEDALADVDPADVDIDSTGDVLTLTLQNKVRCVINTQRPTRQIWVAARASAWHFSYDEATQRWLDDKGRGEELMMTLTNIVQEYANVHIQF